MNKLKLLFGLLIGIAFFSCSSSDDNNDFFNKAYLDIYRTFDGGCYGRLYLTNGTATINSTDGVSLNGDATNVVDFPAVLMNNCELDNPSTKIWDLENGLESELYGLCS